MTKTTYSDQELAEFKTLIELKLTEAEKDLKEYKATLRKTDSNGTDDTLAGHKPFEEGQEVLATETINNLAERQEKFIVHLKNALVRIENKTYGMCKVKGIAISKERLRAVPHATMSIEAKREQP